MYYPLDEGSGAVGDLTAYGKTQFLVIERDSREGSEALIKRIYGSRKHDLPRLKANLVRLQKGQIKVRDPPEEQEWEVVWWHYSRVESS